VAQVVSHHAQIQAANAQVVTVSFEAAYWSQVWLQETQSPFPFLADPDRIAYRAYGLESSVLRSWSPATLWYYVRAARQKHKTFGKRGDPHQLGGDFIIDPHGRIQLAHPSREPTDRPPVDKLLAMLQKMNETREIPLY
jgi:peroxiredoxin